MPERKSPQPSEVWQHTDSGGWYTVVSGCKWKDEKTREWVPGVLYKSRGAPAHDEPFGRTLTDFMANFKSWEEVTRTT